MVTRSVPRLGKYLQDGVSGRIVLAMPFGNGRLHYRADSLPTPMRFLRTVTRCTHDLPLVGCTRSINPCSSQCLYFVRDRPVCRIFRTAAAVSFAMWGSPPWTKNGVIAPRAATGNHEAAGAELASRRRQLRGGVMPCLPTIADSPMA